MKAAVVQALGAPVVIEDRSDPEPGPGRVRIRVEASGLCHTDIHAAHGDWPVRPEPPFVPGHEGVGLVEKPGDGVSHLSVGDRVAAPWLGKACGRFDHCLSGWETLRERQINTGYGTSVIGSIVGTRQDLAEVFPRHAAGRTRVSHETLPQRGDPQLAAVDEAIDEVLRGQVKARIVFGLGAGR
ncbi:alcohol dehydrogenase catalytic domain-containing protein [Streptomyces guryensis]|uniref:alcohol dehydrogenase n=1 Tax=Streptomyces guryensis TaxID=2886947 RepID=A0A9Q3Z632_9ACTN|nr:alcohol dehydrogenase catalytic domain-containing protein [Streptomyces guryensis]MCD9874769.1 alcohol dehydrogenase catalytic domain-containing protein [Streptomyces guryensis]